MFCTQCNCIAYFTLVQILVHTFPKKPWKKGFFLPLIRQIAKTIISSYMRLSKNFEDTIKPRLKPPPLTQVPGTLSGSAVLITGYSDLLGATASPQAVGCRPTIKKELVSQFTSTVPLSMLLGTV